MPKQTRPDDEKGQSTPNPAANKEQAEGSRENTPPDGRDQRDSVAHDRQSHVVNQDAERQADRDDADIDPVMPTGDATLRTKI